MLSLFRPAPHIERLPADKVDPFYKRMRWQVFFGIFFGYAGYYLVRKNFSLAMPYLIEQGFSRGDLGLALSGVSIAYGLSKFLMGNVSDRSNARYFLSAGLLLSAGIMFMMGTVHWATSSIAIMFVLLFLNGWVQGMGWPPCGRTMVHWWSQKERGEVVAVWNVAHNVGGGMIGPLFILGMGWFNDWRSAFYVPAAAAAASVRAAVMPYMRLMSFCNPVRSYRRGGRSFTRLRFTDMMRKRPCSASTVIVPGVSVIELAWMTRPISVVCAGVNSTSVSVIGRRGSSELIGSWKTYCTAERSSRPNLASPSIRNGWKPMRAG